MLLRINAIAVFLLLCSVIALGQSKQDHKDLQRDLQTYKRTTMNLDYDSLLSFMPPKLLAMVPPEQLKTQLKQAFDNETLYMVLDTMDFGEIPQVAKTSDHLYALVPYSGHMEMHFKEQRDSAFMDMMIPMLEAQFAEGAIQLMGADTSLYLSIDLQQKVLIAFKTADFDTWKFIEDKRGPDVPEGDQQLNLLKMVVPSEVLEATK